MKKYIILGIFIVSCLILAGAGCAPKTPKTAAPEEVAPSVNVNEAAEPEAGKTELNVTKEDLDKFKADVQKMEFEDLNALSK
jgi:hypothetical protein